MSFRHFKYSDRLKLEVLFKSNFSKRDIASVLGFSLASIYRELSRGMYDYQKYDLTFERRYSADIAQANADYKATSKGAPLKISHDYDLVRFIENKILKEKWSPDTIIGYIRMKNIKFDTSICTKTLYNYIDKGVFLNVTNKNLPQKCKRKKRGYNKIRTSKKNVLFRSIEERPESVKNRLEFGHWEMDTVIGKREKGACLLVLTERRTRKEIILKLKSRTQGEVKKAIDLLEQTHKNFSKIFRSITVDNGSEFHQNVIENSMKKSVFKRTQAYFCHPYSSWERGSNENMNAMIRRFIKKGESLEKIKESEIKKIEKWLNSYPRKVLNYFTPDEEFKKYA